MTVMRVIRWVLAVAVVEGGLLLILAWLLPGLAIRDVRAALLAGPIVVVGLTLVWGLVYRLSAHFHPFVFPFLSFILTGAVVGAAFRIVDRLAPGAIEGSGVWTGIVVALGLTFGTTLVGALFSLQDDRAYDRFVVRPLRHRYRETPRSESPGVLFLEIDGLAEPILRDALALGHMPTLRRWLDTGSHALRHWEPDLSSQTSASQAGILLGDNTGIPAFRWYDKGQGRLMVSSKLATAWALEQQLSTGQGLLAHDGGSRWNIFSGDAPDCLGTYSKVDRRAGHGQTDYFLYFSNPYTLARTVGLFVADVARERRQARAQRQQGVEPRIERHWKYALVRAGTTTLLQEASLFMLLADMFRGLPAVYTTLFGYDEVAHHSGIDRPETLQVLGTLDRMFATLERASQQAARPYHLVVLSDHGQSQGATFLQRYGYSLDGLVQRLLVQDREDHQVAGAPDTDEGLVGLSTALSAALAGDNRTLRLARRALRGRVREGRVVLDREHQAAEDRAAAQAPTGEVVVLASGNLGLVSFTGWPRRLTFEELADQYPGLLTGLAHHAGISFVMVHSEKDGGLVLGPHGLYYLDHGYAAGEDPLTPFGPNAAAHLRRTDGFPNAPDILVMSRYNPETEEVAAFEELVGCHGGLGGPQTRPFVLYPVTLPLDAAPIVGAAALHQRLKAWVPQGRAGRTEPVTA